MKSQLRILIVAYFFSPSKKVGAIRPSYWYREMKKLGHDVRVWTAEPGNEEEDIRHIPAVSELGFGLKELGSGWKKDLLAYLPKEDFKPDWVIITGSPFLHFSLAGKLKKKWGAQVLLDYRDPFAVNPGFDNNPLKVAIKKYYERKFNRKADALVTVNDFCGKLIENFYKKPNAIIQNGYDETVQPHLKEVELARPSMAYTGRFYFDNYPMFKAFLKEGIAVEYAGNDQKEIEEDVLQDTLFHNRGFVTYKESVDIIAKNDIAVIQTYGEDFQSTTKIFDYIRCERPILIISNKYLKRGSIHEVLTGYPNVFWCENNIEAIRSAIREMKAHVYEKPVGYQTDQFSRKMQMKKLLDLMYSVK